MSQNGLMMQYFEWYLPEDASLWKTLKENAAKLKTMGVTKPKVYVTADPALLLEAGSEGAVDGFLLGNNIDPAGRYALFVLREWQGFEAKKQAFVQSAKQHGINEDDALTLICQTMIGSAKMLLRRDKTPAELIRAVCSPGGTTIEGMKVLENRDLYGIVSEACDKCIKRAYELG